MFNYIRSDQIAKKTIKPIEMKVSMPIDMQPVPQMDPTVTCIYPDMNIQPNTPPQPIPMPPMPMPCSQCMHYNKCMQPMPMPPMPAPMPLPAIPTLYPNIPAPSPSCDMYKAHDDMEVAYIKKMYPPLCQKIQKYVECEINQYDHDLSPIYEMYPSTETIDHMANCIYTDMKADMSNLIKEFEGNPRSPAPMGGSFYTLVYALLLNELYRKRMRKRLYR